MSSPSRLETQIIPNGSEQKSQFLHKGKSQVNTLQPKIKLKLKIKF